MVFVNCFKVDSGVILEFPDNLCCSVGSTRDIMSKESIIDNIITSVFCLIIILIESRR